MEAEPWKRKQTTSISTPVQRPRAVWPGIYVLIALGIVLLGMATSLAFSALVDTGNEVQNRHLATGNTTPLPATTPLPITSPLPIPTANPLPAEDTSPGNTALTNPAPPERSLPAALAMSEDAAQTASSDVDPSARPVEIRIPAIGLQRPVVELPQVQDPSTGTWTQDLDALLRRGRKDLVGHWGGSAYPGLHGNTILVGHNWGYGNKGVFLRIDRLKRGQPIYVFNSAGQTFTYQVTAVERVPWWRRDAEELIRHANFLAKDGPERLTLVTCGGSQVQPFPNRVYVVAEPVGQ